MKKQEKKTVCGLPSVEELRQAKESSAQSEAYARLEALFDPGTFAELGAYLKRGFCDFYEGDKDRELEGVVCGYGAVNGVLTYAFAQDATRMKGAIDRKHADKICALYDLAQKNGAPVVGIFDSAGADIYEGAAALAAYARIMRAVSAASGKIPQIALIGGLCIGCAAATAAMFDFVIPTDKASFYVDSPAFTKVEHAQDVLAAFNGSDILTAISYVRTLLGYLPSNATEGVSVGESTDDLNRRLNAAAITDRAADVIAAVADNGIYLETAGETAPGMTTAFALIGGVRCGIVATSYATDEGRITADGARKAAKFVSFCDAFAIPVVTLVDSLGLSVSAESEGSPFSAELGRLAMAYAASSMPKITVVLGHAIGAAFTLLGAKALGADVCYALDRSEIGVLPSDSAVAFVSEQLAGFADTKEELIGRWRASVASPVAAASLGEIDDIVSAEELRQRICSALFMLASKGTARDYRHAVRPF